MRKPRLNVRQNLVQQVEWIALTKIECWQSRPVKQNRLSSGSNGLNLLTWSQHKIHHVKLPRLSRKLFWCVACGYVPCIDRFYDSRVNIEPYWCLSGAAEAAGRRPRWALMAQLQVEHSHGWGAGLYLVFTAPRKQPGALSLAAGRKGGRSLYPCSIRRGGGGLTRYQHGSTNGNSALIHWLNQSRANTRASSRVKARDVWSHDTDDTVSSAKVTAAHGQWRGSKWKQLECHSVA